MVKDGDCVAIFQSIHRVMKAEKLLKQKKLKILLIPVPRQLSSDCGLAIRFSPELKNEVEKILSEAELSIAEIWQKEGKGFSQLL